MDYAKFIALLKKQKLSEQEQRQLDDWKAQSPELSDQLRQLWDWSGQYEVRYRPDTQKGLEQLRLRMQEEKSAPAVRKLRLLVWRWAAVAAVALGVAIGWPLLSGPDEVVYQTAANEVQEINLPDGSMVVLNEHSILHLLPAFQKGKKRKVTLQGEAFFEIQPDPEQPFEIATDQTHVAVLGTAFKLRAYPGEDSTVVEVVEGKVRFADKKEKLELEANTRAACNHLTEKMKKISDPQLERPDWYYLRAASFREQPLEKVLNFVEERFDISLVLSKKITNAPCSAMITFSIPADQPLDTVLQRLKTTLNAKIVLKGTNQYEIVEIKC